jgi:hypothetical protein
MLAMLRSFQGDQFLQDGDVARAIAAYKEFRQVSVDLQDDDGVSWALLAEAGALAASGELGEARRVAEEGLALAEKIGSRRRVPQANFILFSVELEQGDLAAARVRCANFGELAHELAIPQLEVGMKGCYAATAILAGDLRGAEKLFTEVDALLVKVNLTRERVQLDRHRAYLMFERGDLSGANAILDREMGSAISTTDRLDLQLISALVALDDGRYADAERIGREALGVLTRLKAARAELRMRSLLALALVEQDKRAMAAEVVAPVLAGYETLEGVRDRAFAAIALALTRRDPPSLELLRRAQAAAQQAGLPGTVLRTRLALAEVQGDAGQRAAVARDARARGYLGISRVASVAQ